MKCILKLQTLYCHFFNSCFHKSSLANYNISTDTFIFESYDIQLTFTVLLPVTLNSLLWEKLNEQIAGLFVVHYGSISLHFAKGTHQGMNRIHLCNQLACRFPSRSWFLYDSGMCLCEHTESQYIFTVFPYDNGIHL